MPKKKFELENDQEAISSAEKRRKINCDDTRTPTTNAPKRKFAPEAYTVGWICAISTERVAAQTFLDEKHEGPEDISTHDNNSYQLGRIGKHNVVIAVLPDGEYGTSSAASAARDMLHSFPNTRIGLMVGIGGGAPSPSHDIRLGDIVVSAPRDGKGGVFQYDFGETIQNQTFRPTGFLDQPPMVLRAAVNGLKTKYEEEGHRLEDAINNVLQKNPRLRKKYQRPDPSTDRLYRSGVVHPQKDSSSCTVFCGDDISKLILRPGRTEDEDNPTIHYGLIASANQLMKDASVRDKLAAEMDVLCFEMEAAGLMNHFPCLVIRGICDYSDSHKNKEWQGYAAMAAAAYAKDLLLRIPTNRVEAERKISDVLSSVEQTVHEIRYDVKDVAFEQRGEKIERWLLPSDPSTNYNKALQQRQKGTGLWFLQNDAFTNWRRQRNSFLWLCGIPGSGKTILSSTIVEDLKRSLPDQLLYFYFDFNDTGKQILESMVRSLISQLYCTCEDALEQLDSLFSSCDDGRRQPSCESLCKVLLQMMEQAKEVWVVLDALDECNTRKGPPTEGLLSWIRDLLNSEQRNVHLLVTSRPEQDIKLGLSDLAHNNTVPIQSGLIGDDIRGYIRARVREGDDLKRWRSHPDIQDEIETRLMQKANGMFRWAACQIDALENCLDYRTLENALASLPRTLDGTYSRILNGIPSEHKQNATRILQFLTFSERPLRIEEAVDAITVDTEGVQYFSPKYRMPDPREISRYCSSLVVMVSAAGHSHEEDDERVEIQLAHLSVKEYLMSDRLDSGIAQDFQEATARASIAKVCLAYLLHLDQDAPPEKIRKTFPLAQYSAISWTTHAAVAKGKDKRLQVLIEKFFCDHEWSYKTCHSLYRPDQAWDGVSTFGIDDLASPLYYASFGGFENAVQCLFSRGADVNAQGGCYGNALYAASLNGHEKVVELLLDKGADVNAKGGFSGNYALNEYQTQLVLLEQQNKRRMLLARGHDVDPQGGYGKWADGYRRGNWKDGYYGNALQAASANGHEKVVKLLLSKGADVNAQGGTYGNALQEASANGHEKVVKLLLNRGAGADAQGG
ncbi:hypothetical protein DL771_002594 [Monosporascus sp. 5C6A]|nr:hypothetical protein DL771_002594 [Monosporascus sp. 5C6A]